MPSDNYSMTLTFARWSLYQALDEELDANAMPIRRHRSGVEPRGLWLTDTRMGRAVGMAELSSQASLETLRHTDKTTAQIMEL